MALSVSKTNQKIPRDAVMLEREQALKYQMILVRKWEPLSEVIGLRFGPGALAFVSGISGIAILSHFRKKLKVGVYGKVTSFFPGVVLPSALAALLHSILIQNKILLSEYNCPVCLQTRAAVAQVATSVVYPFLLSPMSTFFYATRHFTVRLPYITEEPKAWLKLWIKLMRSGKSIAGYCFAANVVGAIAVTSIEFSQFLNLQSKLEEFEKQVESGSVLNEN